VIGLAVFVVVYAALSVPGPLGGSTFREAGTDALTIVAITLVVLGVWRRWRVRYAPPR
jgi:hypothetical protein